MLLEHHREMFAWDHWACGEALASIETATTYPERAVLALGHIMGARQVWLRRLLHDTTPTDVFPRLTLDQCAALLAETTRGWDDYLATLDEARLGEPLDYVNLRGQANRRAIGHIITTVPLHGQHHRGQIASIVRDCGGKPASTDYIFYVTVRGQS